jgi:hypothetical protein
MGVSWWWVTRDGHTKQGDDGEHKERYQKSTTR